MTIKKNKFNYEEVSKEDKLEKEENVLFNSDQNSDIFRLNNIASGSTMEVDLDVEVIDIYNQTIKTLIKG